MEQIQTSLRIRPELWAAFKIEAIKRNLTTGKLLEMTIEKELRRSGNK